MQNPYADVNWETAEHLHSVNHEHTFAPNVGGEAWVEGEPWCTPQEVFDSLYDRGIRHFAISNYHPAKPTYPLGDYHTDVPADALGCPNAEHSIAGQGHYCSIGSTFATVNSTNEQPWEDLFRGMLDEMVYDGGGGIVINHPRRTGLSVDAIEERLAFDDRVLGMEVWNHRGIAREKYGSRGNALSTWDELLTAETQAFGFFNPDYHAPWDDSKWGEKARGRNVLLVPDHTEAAAASAYREGCLYGALDGSGLRFERIDATEEAVTVETDRPSCIRFITKSQAVAVEHGRSASYELTGREPYVRIEALDEHGEHLFSQPIAFDSADGSR